jgi:hypothetical protein
MQRFSLQFWAAYIHYIRQPLNIGLEWKATKASNQILQSAEKKNYTNLMNVGYTNSWVKVYNA